MKNKSEKQLKKFVKFHKKEITNFTLSPQGDNAMISEKSINLCKVYSDEMVYYFGGISENFYDKIYLNFFMDKTTNKK